MSLSQVEWRSYLDDILDEHMRLHVVVDSREYISAEVERLFGEALHTISEYSSSNFFVPTESLDNLLKHPDLQRLISEVGIGAPDEKWKASKNVLEYIKGVISSSTAKNRRVPTIDCWLEDDDFAIPSRLDRPLLSRRAVNETPLRYAQGTPADRTVKRKPNLPRAVKPSERTTPSAFTPNTRKSIVAAKIEEEHVDEQEAEKLIVPKPLVPRNDGREVLACIKNNPFYSSTNSSNNTSLAPSDVYIRENDDKYQPFTTKVFDHDPISPPLFARPPRDKNSLDIRKHTKGLYPLKPQIVPAQYPSDMNEENNDMETMRIIEGWPPISVSFSSTPPSTMDVSGESPNSGEDDALEIDELKMPSSPPITNKELKELFRSRMENILLPKSEVLTRSHAVESKSNGLNIIQGDSLRDVLSRTMDLVPVSDGVSPTKSSHPRIAGGIPQNLVQYAPSILQSIVGVADSDGDLALGPETSTFLDEICQDVNGLDKYAVITREGIEEKDGSLMHVPFLPEPNDQLYHLYCIPTNMQQLVRPFTVMDATNPSGQHNSFGSSNSDRMVLPNHSITFLELSSGIASLLLELSWQPFVYQGPLISHETVCAIHTNPFNSANMEDNSEETLLASATQSVLEKLDRDYRNKEAGATESGWISDENAHSPGLVTNGSWSTDGALLLTRRERTRLQHTKTMANFPFREIVKNDGVSKEDPISGLINGYHTEDKLREGRREKNETAAQTREEVEEVDMRILPYKRGQMNEGATTPNSGSSKTMGVQNYGQPVTDNGSSLFRGARTGHHQPDTPGQLLEGVQALESASLIRNEEIIYPTPTNQPYFGQTSPVPDTQASTKLSNMSTLRSFLEQRGFNPKKVTPSEIMDSFDIEGPRTEASTPDRSISRYGDRLPDSVFPPEILSQNVILPTAWISPTETHHYIVSLALLQRRSLVQCLKEGCNVRLTEILDLNGPELIVDSHSAVTFLTMSEVVPTNVANLSSALVELAYGFDRILVILEAYPKSRSDYSLERLRSEQAEDLHVITETVASTCRRLKRNVGIGMGVIGVDDENGGIELGEVGVEFVLARNVEESARLIRVFAEFAEASVGDWERKKLWGLRSWLEETGDEELVRRLAYLRGMNVFAALAISSVMPLQVFLDMELEDKLHQFGALAGPFRMALFHELYHQNRVEFVHG